MIDENPQEQEGRSRRKNPLLTKLNHYLDLITRKWWVPVVGSVVGVAAGIAVYQTPTPLFTSVGRMIVSLKVNNDKVGGGGYSEDLNNFLGTQAELMVSDVVSNRASFRMAASGTNLQSKPVLLRVSVSPKTSIFIFRAYGLDPEATQKFVQASMEEYINLKRDMRKQASDNTVADMIEETQTLSRELRAAQEEIVSFESTNSLLWLQQQGNSVGSYGSSLNQKLEDMKSEHNLLNTLTLDQNLERQAATVGSTAPAAGTNSPAGSSISNSPAQSSNDQPSQDYLKAKQQVMLQKADLQDLSQFLRPKHPKVIAMKEEIVRTERLLEMFRGETADQLENKKVALEAQIRNTENDVKIWNVKVVELSRKTAEYQRLKSSAQRIQSLYEQLLASIQTIDVNKGITGESVSIAENATPAALVPPSGELQKPLTYGLGCLALSLAILLIIDRLDDRLNSLAELQDVFSEEVLVQIPREKVIESTGETPLIQLDDTRHGFMEAYRNLRSSLLYMSQTGIQPKTILVTSSIPNEGKSLTSANLAVILALTGSRVLLVDADLRKGVQHKRFDLEPGAGLSGILGKGLPWEEAVVATKFPTLFLIPRGDTTQSSSELFLSPATPAFLKQASAKYDYVIIDTAPVMAADDVTSLAPHADTTLFVLRAEHTSGRVAQAALDMLYHRQVKVLGIVFNSVRPSSTGYYYYYNYKDYNLTDTTRSKGRKKGGAKKREESAKIEA